jgi:2-polyprenyl-3-methyl-5-hydroxy-6-metoxy-1,4-benzoquinol methylase
VNVINDHDWQLAEAFDSQAPKFERAPVQSDPVALARLVQEASFPPACRVLDAGCGPGLVSRAFLAAGYRVVGVDLSPEMIERAKARCAEFGDTARFLNTSLFDDTLTALGPFDATISRYVLHHVVDPVAFVERQVELLGPRGVLVMCDHVTEPDPVRSAHHDAIEVGRDKTHTRNHTGGQLVDLCAAAGLREIRLVEESFSLDFDEWFDRSTPSKPKNAVRALVLSGPSIRSFGPTLQEDGSIRIGCIRAIVRGIKPDT